jgi:predicted ATPase
MTEAADRSTSIRTPDQRLRVFVSSTLAELADERRAASRAISSVGLTPVLFELGARPHPPQDLYRAYLAQSDIFIGLYWQRYGWVGPGMDISGLEDEFQLSGSLPRLLYVKTPAPDREAGLTAMIEQLQSDGTEAYRSFSTTDELEQLVRDDLALLLSERFTVVREAPTAARPARSLPVTATSLLGRDRDIDEVAGLLQTPEVRLITLTGPGGIGKTRLAIAVGERLEDRFPQGAVFVPLASLTEPALVMARIAGALGASMEGTRPARDVVIERVGDTPTLLVLDNLEQVVAVAPELDRLLSSCPGLEILATSRTVLRLRAEREYPVSPLSVPHFAEQPRLQQLASLPAVQLFVDRAQAVRYDFTLSEDNAPAVAEIGRRLDGLPLAIELAAARTRLLEPAALLARLESSLDALGSGPVDLPERQRTLRATVEWSIGLLDEPERDMLATLSVFVDGWTIDAALTVADLTEDRTLDLLDTLAGHSLVGVDANNVEPRFRMLQSIRDVAAEQLVAERDSDELERRHAAHFGSLVARNDWPMQQHAEWAEQLQPDEGNLRAAIRWFLGHDIAPLPHMFRILWLFWQMRDRMPEGRAWVAELLTKADALDDRGHLELMFTSAITATEVGDDDGALAALDGIKQYEANISDRYLQSAAQLAASWTLPIVDDLEGARLAAANALVGFRELDEPFVGWAALTVGLLEMALDRDDAASADLTEAYELGRQFGNHWLESSAGTQLAALAVKSGRLADARALLTNAVDSRDGAQLTIQALTFALISAAQLAIAEGDAPRAATAMGAASGLRDRAGLKAWPSMRRNEANVAARLKESLEPTAFDAAFEEGRRLGRAEAISLVRADP